MLMTPTTIIVSLGVFAFGYSFGGDVRVRESVDRHVALTSFGGEIDVPRAPKGARLRSFGGDVHVGTALGRVQATSYGGTIDIAELGGNARLTSFGGDVEVSVAEMDQASPRRIFIRSYGGDVTVHFPSGFDATIDVRARCRPGREERCGVDSDFDLDQTRRKVRTLGTLMKKRSETRSRATLGDGRHHVTILLEEATARLRRD